MWKLRSLKENKSGYAAVVGTVVAVLITIAIGLLLYYKIIAGLLNGASLPTAGYTAIANLNTTANSVFTLAPIIAIVLIAGIILAVVMGFGRQTA